MLRGILLNAQTMIRRKLQSAGESAMSTLRTHPIAATFPPVSGALFDALMTDMRSNGQRLPIVLYDGMIWDGRARYQACAELGLKPWLVPLRREDPRRVLYPLELRPRRAAKLAHSESRRCCIVKSWQRCCQRRGARTAI
jgi:hypothetical protein